MVSRKRGRAEMESPAPAQELGLLDRIRNMWEFANLMQYIFIFGKAVRIHEDLDIEVHNSLWSSQLALRFSPTSWTGLTVACSAGA